MFYFLSDFTPKGRLHTWCEFQFSDVLCGDLNRNGALICFQIGLHLCSSCDWVRNKISHKSYTHIFFSSLQRLIANESTHKIIAKLLILTFSFNSMQSNNLRPFSFCGNCRLRVELWENKMKTQKNFYYL